MTYNFNSGFRKKESSKPVKPLYNDTKKSRAQSRLFSPLTLKFNLKPDRNP